VTTVIHLCVNDVVVIHNIVVIDIHGFVTTDVALTKLTIENVHRTIQTRKGIALAVRAPDTVLINRVLVVAVKFGKSADGGVGDDGHGCSYL